MGKTFATLQVMDKEGNIHNLPVYCDDNFMLQLLSQYIDSISTKKRKKCFENRVRIEVTDE